MITFLRYTNIAQILRYMILYYYISHDS